MLERGEGYLVGTASGAAFTAEPGVLAHSVTKHAMPATAGSRCRAFCPFGMLTPMLLGGVASVDELPPSMQVGLRGAVEPHVAADAVAEGLRRVYAAH